MENSRDSCAALRSILVQNTINRVALLNAKKNINKDLLSQCRKSRIELNDVERDCMPFGIFIPWCWTEPNRIVNKFKKIYKGGKDEMHEKDIKISELRLEYDELKTTSINYVPIIIKK
jgi:hypothetical protein